ncbi:MAG: hypothetical protein EPN91_00750 [Salinibacterium sp.]|nr:MAG: hypothetical protein EPN91_00750 [Salinibacterium sp.]
MKQFLNDLWNGEPTFVLGIIRAVLVVGVLLFLHLAPEQAAAIYGVIEAATTYYNRSKVTPA